MRYTDAKQYLLGGSFDGKWSFSVGIGTIGCAGGIAWTGCRAKRGSRVRMLLTNAEFTGAIRVRTFAGGIGFGINVGCAIILTGLLMTCGTMACFVSSCGFIIFVGSTIGGSDVGNVVGTTAVGGNPNCLWVAANSNSNFRFFNSNNSRCFICNSVWISFSVYETK